MLKYDKELPWQEFARLSVFHLDLDPVYCALASSGWDEATLLRWCAAFVTFYHMGTASQVCDLQGDAFWSELWSRYDFAPRAAERRHFRGEAGRKAITAWRNTYGTPEKFAIACMRPSFREIFNAGIPQIGAYFTWKWGDFREAVFGYDMDWAGAEKNMVALPQQGLAYLFHDEKPSESIWKVVEAIAHLDAPPRFSRKCGLAEAETVSCMVKGYYLNKVPIGHDILDKRAALTGFGERADHLLSVMPLEPFDEA